MELAWTTGNWEFFALGQGEQDGIRVAREIMQALPVAANLATGAVKGKLRAAQTGNPLYVTASWTYDSKTWYTMDGRNTPANIVKMLQSATRLSSEPRKHRYYPQIPEKITTPEMAVQAYFDALYYGGAVSMSREPYQAAYNYWSTEWQVQKSYDQFLASWQGTANVELIKLLPAGEENGQPRFFVETRHLETVGEKPHTGIFYYTGFFTIGQTAAGWRITSGELEPENLAWKLGGHQPWRRDPEMVAHVELGESIARPLGEAITENNPDGTVIVRYVDTNGKETHRAVLVQALDGIWRVIYRQ